VRFSPDGSVLYTWVQENRQQKLGAYEVATGQALGTVDGATTDVGSYAMSADGRHLVTRHGGGADCVDMTTGKRLANYPIDKPGDRFSAGMALSPDGKTLAVVRLNLDRVLASRSPVRVPIKNPGHPRTLLEEFMGTGDVPPPADTKEASDKTKDEKQAKEVVPVRAATAVELFDASTGQLLVNLPYAEMSTFLPDGKTMASYYPDEQVVRLWNVPPRPVVPWFTVWVLVGIALALSIACLVTWNRDREPSWE